MAQSMRRTDEASCGISQRKPTPTSWRGARLPSEAQYHSAAFGAGDEARTEIWETSALLLQCFEYLHPSGFDELMPKTLATATVDRLLHHAHLCQTSGDSVRLAQALHGKGVKPLT